MSDTSRDTIYGVDASERNTRLLRIKVLRATDLQQRDFLGGSRDPYVKVLLQARADRNQTIDIACTRTEPKTLNPVWNQDFIFRVDPAKHRLVFEIYEQKKLTEDEFLGMFYVELNLNIPYESDEQPPLTKDYTLLKRDVLQRVRASATVALSYINLNKEITKAAPTDAESASQSEPKLEMINHGDLVEPAAAPEPPLPSGWEERKDALGRTYYVDHITRTTTRTRPNGRNIAVADRHEIGDMEASKARSSTTRSATGSTSSDDLGPLPPGWQISRTEGDQLFFIDHINKRTTWIDPRTSKPSAQRDTNRDASLPEHWEKRTLPDGRVYYIDHLNKKTTWTDPRLAEATVPNSPDYETKCRLFRRSLPESKSDVNTQLELHVRRKDVMETSFHAIMNIKDVDVLETSKFRIVFEDEQTLDSDDLSREWFSILSREIFNPYNGLFEYSGIKNCSLQINPFSGLFNEEHIKYFRFIGRILGMAIYHDKLLEAFFIRPFYKMLLSKAITLDDMKSVDREYYQSLKYILDNDPADLDLNFVVTEEVLGELREHELKVNGQQIPVTEQNKHEYIELVINNRFVRRIETQMNALKQGFQDIFPLDSLKVFDEKEVELLISGPQQIDVNDWKAHTVYKGGYTSDNPVIQHFWKAIDSFNTEERTRLLQFVTGTSRLPMNGFSELWGSSHRQLFTIEKWGDHTRLPYAFTNVNRLDLPPYESYEDLRQKLIQAMEISEAYEGVD